MAITINGGTNAITGLATGGLPDGSVDADTLAANAVIAAKIAADAIDGTKISDDAIAAEHVADDAIGIAQLSTSGTAGSSNFLRGDNAWAAAGGGKILQIAYNTGTTTIEANASNSHVDIINTSITPASTSSKVLVICNATIASNAGSNSYAGGYIFRGTASGGTNIKQWSFGQSATHENFITPWTLDSPNTTSSQQYTWTISKWSSGTTNNQALGSAGYCILLMEVGA